jgi:hypothetical protein
MNLIKRRAWKICWTFVFTLSKLTGHWNLNDVFNRLSIWRTLVVDIIFQNLMVIYRYNESTIQSRNTRTLTEFSLQLSEMVEDRT